MSPEPAPTPVAANAAPRIATLMYHALYDGSGERERIDPEDRPYAVSVEAFEAQLDHLAAEGITVVDPREAGRAAGRMQVVLTFDDGHASNHRHAFAILARRRLPAIFFVTSDFIGARPGFCAWPQLREMAEGGMCVESHGMTHRFFDDLTPAEAEEEFRRSGAAIAQGAGRAPTMISFPGGRFRNASLAIGKAAGYRHFYSSIPGIDSPAAFGAGGLVRRIAIRDATPLDAFASALSGRSLALTKARAAWALKTALRRTLGNRAYHSLYERFAR